MIYELRQYTANSGKMSALQARFRDHTMKLFEKHGMTNVGYWTNVIGGFNDEFIYMLAYPDLAAREKSWAAFSTDPEWIKTRAESETSDGIPLNQHFTNRILTPTDFSPLK